MSKKDLNKMTVTELKKELETLEKKKTKVTKSSAKGSPYLIGANYMIRTVTMIYTGKLMNVYDKELTLSECAWIADTGRWQQACEKGTFDEVEPYPTDAEVIINKEAVLDSFIVTWQLPKEQK